MKIDYYLKALAGGLTAALTALGGMLTAPEATLATVTAGQWVAVALAFIAGLGFVYAIPNAERPPKQEPMWVGTEDFDELYEDNLATGTAAFTDLLGDAR